MGYRLTPQRTLVWDVLRREERHMSAEEVCALVQEQFPHVNISTVYRTLELLVELDLVRETHLGPARRFFEVEEEVPHHHLVCETCGSVTHLHDEDLGTLLEVMKTEQGFAPRELTIFGSCESCKGGVRGGEHREGGVREEGADGRIQGAGHARP
jgi:Fur family ferric uptake transcriptional regulator